MQECQFVRRVFNPWEKTASSECTPRTQPTTFQPTATKKHEIINYQTSIENIAMLLSERQDALGTNRNHTVHASHASINF